MMVACDAVSGEWRPVEPRAGVMAVCQRRHWIEERRGERQALGMKKQFNNMITPIAGARMELRLLMTWLNDDPEQKLVEH